MTRGSNEPWAAWADHMQKWMATPGANNPFATPAGFTNPFAAFTGAGALDPQSIMKAIDPVEIDRRIQDMRAVEAWLKLSLSTLEVSIKTMEMQRDAYASMSAMSQSAAEATTKATNAVKRAARTRASGAKRSRK